MGLWYLIHVEAVLDWLDLLCHHNRTNIYTYRSDDNRAGALIIRFEASYMSALQRCLASYPYSVQYSSLSAASSGFRSWLFSKKPTARRSHIEYARFQVDKALVDSHDLFRHSNKKQQGATLPSKERLDEVEKIIGCVLCDPLLVLVLHGFTAYVSRARHLLLPALSPVISKICASEPVSHSLLPSALTEAASEACDLQNSSSAPAQLVAWSIPAWQCWQIL